MPIWRYRSNWVSGSSTASRISCFWMSMPPMSEYLLRARTRRALESVAGSHGETEHEGEGTHTSGRSSAPSMLMLESASGGRTSTSAFEWRCRATLELGLRSSRSMVLRMRTT